MLAARSPDAECHVGGEFAETCRRDRSEMWCGWGSPDMVAEVFGRRYVVGTGFLAVAVVSGRLRTRASQDLTGFDGWGRGGRGGRFWSLLSVASGRSERFRQVLEEI